jgi:hypothetical protein
MEDEAIAVRAFTNAPKDKQPVAVGGGGVSPSAAGSLTPRRKEIVEHLVRHSAVLGQQRAAALVTHRAETTPDR